jgi:hypothetical protein
MATNFPTSLDTFTNPNSGNTLDSPSHSVQHSDINDAVEAIEAKIGVGSSTAGSATAGYALVNTSGGTTAYSLLGVSGLSSGTAVANTFLRANGSGAATFAPTAQGLTLLIPSSVAVGSGTGTVSATGTVDFSGASSVSINDVFSATYNNYKVLLRLTAASEDLTPSLRFRVSGADNSTANYSRTAFFAGSDGTSGTNNTSGATSYGLGTFDTTVPTYHLHDMLISLPFATDYTILTNLSTTRNGSANNFVNAESCFFNATTSFTGFSIIASTGNFTGSVSIFGINK